MTARLRIEVSVMDGPMFEAFVGRIQEFIGEYSGHHRMCAAVDADGDWHAGNPACDCGYVEALASLVPPALSRRAALDTEPT